MASKRLKLVSVKGWSVHGVPKPAESPGYYVAALAVFLIFVFFPYAFRLGLTARLLWALVLYVPLFALSQWTFSSLESSERLALLLERFWNPQLSKDSFHGAPFPKNWNDYFVLQLKLADLTPLSYPIKDAAPERCEIAAYQVYSFLDKPQWIKFPEKGPGAKSHFVNRVSRGDAASDATNKFSSTEIQSYARSRRVHLEDNPAVWVTGIEKDGDALTIYRNDPHYFSCYVLNNNVWFQSHGFPVELSDHQQMGYPFFLLQKSLPDFKRGSYEAMAENPPILGVEVLVVTSDGYVILQQRSAGVAGRHGLLVSSVSGGLEPDDFRSQDGGDEEGNVFAGALRETTREIGIGRDQIKRYCTLGLFHLVPSNELNFVVLMEMTLGLNEFIKMLRKLARGRGAAGEGSVAEERWEYWKILPVSRDEILSGSGALREQLRKHPRRFESLIGPLYFYCLGAPDVDSLPWHVP